LPKIGPLKALKIREPGHEAEKLFIQSFDTVLINFTSSMKLSGPGNTEFVNVDFDTGNKTVPGEYELADVTFGYLIIKVSKKNPNGLASALKQNILEFYGNPGAAIAAKNEKIEWKRIEKALGRLNLK